MVAPTGAVSVGVVSVVLVAQGGFMTVGTPTHVDVSYLSDTIVVFRSFEGEGEIRRCLAAVKKRQSAHQTSIRELVISNEGITIGREPLVEYRGMFTGAGTAAVARGGTG